MKKIFYLLPVILVGFVLLTGQNVPDEAKWNQPMQTNVYDPSAVYSDKLPVVRDYFNPLATNRTIETPYEVLEVTPNVRVLPRTNSWQSEVDIKRHPLNPLIMFGSSNSFNNVSGTLFISEGVYVTTNGGVTWFGSDTTQGAPIGNHGGDPGITIDKNGTFIQTHLGYSTSGMFANYSTNNGSTWSATYTITTGSQDKNLAATDDAPASPYYGRSYVVWSLFNLASPPIGISSTTNGGVSWSAVTQINTSVAGHYSQGCDVAVGPNGEVYVIWAAPISGSPFTEDFAGFAKSTNGGVSWTVTNNAFDMNGVRSTNFNGWGIRTNSFPRISVDKSGGPRNGWIYVTTSGLNIAPAGSDADILVYKSTNGGTSWSTGVRANQDPINNGRVQWFPAIRVDEAGGVNVVYYDNRATADSAQIYLSRSLDGGVTYSDVLVSDHKYKPKPITVGGIAGGYAGDYIGVTSGSGKLWPIWMDDITGIYQAWTTAVQIETFPLNAFNLNTPAPGTRIETLPNNTTQYNFGWDTSASTASYKWVFGSPTTNPRLITIQPNGNSLTQTSGQLDILLAGLGVAQGDSLVGQWDIWAFRNNQTNDSLKSANGPRAITLKRKKPALTAFNLVTPVNSSTVLTWSAITTPVNINWRKSGEAVTYKWLYASPNFSSQSNIKIIAQSNSAGFDTSLTYRTSQLDSILAGLGIGVGQSSVGQYRVYAYSGADSLASAQTYAITLRRGTPPTVTTSADSIVVNLPFGSNQTSRNLSIGNTGEFGLNWTISESSLGLDNTWVNTNTFTEDQMRDMANAPKGSADMYHGPDVTDGVGGPDAGGYRWIDSDEPGGPTFNWFEISGIGTQITTWTNGTGDDGSANVTLPFNFSYYGTNYSQLKICTNGWVSFDVASTNSAYTNTAIPAVAEPNNALLPFWDDLDVRTSGGIFYYYDAPNSRFVVQYNNVPHFSSGGPYTFQVFLYNTGKIVYQYLNMVTLLNSATIGNENQTGSTGLQMVFNNTYVHNNLAIKIEKGIEWVDETPALGTILPSSNQNVNVTFNSTGLSVGSYSGNINVNSNDPATPVKNVFVKLNVTLAVPATITLIPQAFYNIGPNNLNMSDTVDIYMRSTVSPYPIVDMATGVIDATTFTGSFLFATAPSGTYYLQVKHRNALETWSKAGGEVYTAGSAFSYNFTTASTQAYGSNMILKGTKQCFFSGDVNQDGTIDASDVSAVDNDAFNFSSGYLATDVNGDGSVDGTDVSVADNNAFNFVSKVVPPGAGPVEFSRENNNGSKTSEQSNGSSTSTKKAERGVRE
jgi:hypothetical protein